MEPTLGARLRAEARATLKSLWTVCHALLVLVESALFAVGAAVPLGVRAMQLVPFHWLWFVALGLCLWSAVAWTIFRIKPGPLLHFTLNLFWFGMLYVIPVTLPWYVRTQYGRTIF